jgi:hypothetical protein
LPVFSSILIGFTGGAPVVLPPDVRRFPAIVSANASDLFVAPSGKRLNAGFNALSLLGKGKVEAGSLPGYIDADYVGNNLVDIEQDLVDSGLANLAAAYPADETEVIEFTLHDCSILKVYDSFTFDSNVSGTFRLNYAEYDIVKNEIVAKAYRIA